MHVGFYKADGWHDINAQATHLINQKFQLSLDPEACELYLGVKHAILEVVLGLGRQFPFKKRIMYLKSLDPFIDSCVVDFSKAGFKMESILESQLGEIEENIEVGAKDILCVLYPKNDGLIGKNYPIDPLKNLLLERRLISVTVSYSGHQIENGFSMAGDFEVCIYSYAKNISLVHRGERARYSAMMSPHFYWARDVLSKFEELLDMEFCERPNEVRTFENLPEASWKNYYPKSDSARCFDRAVIYWEDMDGYAMVDELARQLDYDFDLESDFSILETASLSRWGGLNTMTWLSDQNTLIGANSHRGLVILSASILNDQLPAKIASSRDVVMSKQG